MKEILIAVGAILIIIAIVAGGWLAGWWFTGTDPDSIQRVGYVQYQTQQDYIAQVKDIDRNVASIGLRLTFTSMSSDQGTELKDHRVALVREGCALAHAITDPTPDIIIFKQIRCSA